MEQLFEERCDLLAQDGRADHLAVAGHDVRLTYTELDDRANQLARFLVEQGVRPGDRVGLLFDQPTDGYVGMLAALKARAAYVPLDVGFPPDRLAYIVGDSGTRLILSRSHLAQHARAMPETVSLLHLDLAQEEVAARGRDRLSHDAAPAAVDDVCYIIYTSGTTGRPKGVPIAHSSICNFVKVAAEVYGITSDDRVYQGMTLAFDFSVEEIWVPWMAGATLVPRTAAHNLVGAELHAYLTEHRVTALCCVPTLLATLEQDLPELRFLLVSGEACPQDLVYRWHRPGRRYLNVYGPTEATVTATWTTLHPGRPVTIGVPLPTYSVVILDPETNQALPAGQLGEIGIAGIGLSRGYLHRPDLTDKAFVPDFIGIPGNPSGRIYRTGDLGRVTADGEVEYHGRIDTQVKIRGYRVELTEIESVMLQLPGIAQAVVAAYEPAPGETELVGYYTVRKDSLTGPGDNDVRVTDIHAGLRQRLPAYMVPTWLEQLAAIPTLTSGKADRAKLPAPSGRRLLASASEYATPSTPAEQIFAEVLATSLGVERVSVDSHFFDDLGANSLLMARFNAALRTRTGLAVSMKDVYLHPTIRGLAAATASFDQTFNGSGQHGATDARGASATSAASTGAASTGGFVLCGALQLLAFVCYACVASVALAAGSIWIAAGHGVLAVCERLLAFGGGGLLLTGIAPIPAKWALVGRWRPQQIRVWSLAYVGFWIVRTLIVANPLARLGVGTPLYNMYLRALGARIGPGAVVFTSHVPVCTDLLTIGAGAVIRKDCHLSGYRVRSGVIETGSITIGAGAFVGEQTLIDIDTVIGDGAQLGHASALVAGQVVPRGECWHGVPARPADPGCDYYTLPAANCSRARRARYAGIRLLLTLTVAAPLAVAVACLGLTHPALLLARLPGLNRPGVIWSAVPDALVIAIAIVVGMVFAGLLVAATVPRLLARGLHPGQIYPLYGLHYTLQRAISRLSNVTFLNGLFGDSSAIVHYLRLIGYRLTPFEQTGSNFGMAVKHEIPSLAFIGTGTMVSDGLSLLNAEFSSSSFRVLPTAIGARNFLGNGIAYPAQGRTGENCLIATKAMIPITGPIRKGVGLLGSPCFEIPRSVQRDHQFDHLATGRVFRRRLARKNRHNARTALMHLAVRCGYLAGLLVAAFVPIAGAGAPPWAATLATILVDLAFTVVYFVLVERATTRFRGLRPQVCSIYDRAFWRHERYWKVPATAYLHIFGGTPLQGTMFRLVGVRVGRRLFDDGCAIIERTLVTLGDDVTLNAGTTLQGHSLEDGVFKSDRITIGSGCTVGPSAFVHYGAVMGDGSELGADAFLMKGEYLAPGACWGGNPATEITSATEWDEDEHLRGARVGSP